MAAEESSSYIDYDAFTSPTFSPTAYANSLVLQANNPNDTPLDLSTPLSRVLFDAQEVDTHIDTLTTQHARPIVEHTRTRADASAHILAAVEEQVRSLNESYRRLEVEVVQRHEAAEQVCLTAERMVRTLRLGRAVQRAAQTARQLDSHMDELGRGTSSTAISSGSHRAMLPATSTLLVLRSMFTDPQDGPDLTRVQVVTSLRQDIVAPAERTLLTRAQQTVREFNLSTLATAGSTNTTETGGTNTQTFAQTEDAKSKITSALQSLYLLSPLPSGKAGKQGGVFEPTLLLTTLQTYIQTALTSSVAALSRALATLPTLDRALLEIAARCQNLVALEALLETTRAPAHPMVRAAGEESHERLNIEIIESGDKDFLAPLLRHLDTSSLPSYFWRSMAGQLGGRVQDILTRGGVSARTLRSNRDRVRDGIRECVERGSQMPVSGLGGKRERKTGNFEREAAVMVQSVVGPMQK